jgi:hypothetical protein
MPKLSTTSRNTRLTGVVNSAGSNAVVRVYGGTPPATADTALSGNPLLAELVVSGTFGTTSSGVLTVGTVTNDSSANTNGTPTFARVLTSGLTVVAQVTAGVGSGEINFNTAISAGQTVAISSFTITDSTT